MAQLRAAGLALPTVVSLLVAVVLVAIAAIAVQRAGCTDPGRYISTSGGGYELVGGCLEPGDLLVPPASPTRTPAPANGALIRG